MCQLDRYVRTTTMQIDPSHARNQSVGSTRPRKVGTHSFVAILPTSEYIYLVPEASKFVVNLFLTPHGVFRLPCW